jgi:hypothetical protein
MISRSQSTSTFGNHFVTISAVLLCSRLSSPNFATTEAALLLRLQVILPVDALDRLDDVGLTEHIYCYLYDLPVKKPCIHF